MKHQRFGTDGQSTNDGCYRSVRARKSVLHGWNGNSRDGMSEREREARESTEHNIKSGRPSPKFHKQQKNC